MLIEFFIKHFYYCIIKFYIIKTKIFFNFIMFILSIFINKVGIGDWGLGIGDWGLGLGPIPNPQSPIPNPQSPF